MNKRNVLIVARLFFGLLTFIAVVIQLTIHVRHGYNVVNFFSYFTNLSNLFAAFVLVLFAVKSLLGKTLNPFDDSLRGAAVTYMVIVGVVFAILLRDVDLGSLQPWINTLLHYVMPVVMVADWLYTSARTKLRFMSVFPWLVFPLVYLIYSMVRGALTQFYAYPFLSPHQTGGYVAVGVYAFCILALFFVTGALVVFVQKKRRA